MLDVVPSKQLFALEDTWGMRSPTAVMQLNTHQEVVALIGGYGVCLVASHHVR